MTTAEKDEVATCLAGLARLEADLGCPVADADVKWRSHALPPHVRVNSPIRLKAMLVRGTDPYGHFDLIKPPAAERDAAALAVHQAVSDCYRANYREQVKHHAARFAQA
jgi:hypothetical protein